MAKNKYSPRTITGENTDEDLLLLQQLLDEEMYDSSEKSLYSFFVNFWDTFDPSPLVPNWHLECMCEHIEAALRRQIRRLVINISPRSSKSTVGSISSPPWWWLSHPEEKFWLLSHSLPLVTQNIVYSRRILDHYKYTDRWCDPENPYYYRYNLTKDVNTKSRIENDSGGYILGGSHKTGALGMGYSVAILDDMLDSREAKNPGAVAAVNDWYTQTLMNRSNNVNDDVQIILMQRLNAGDLTKYVQETYPEQDWFVLNIPARYDPDRTFVSPIGYNDKRTRRNQLMDPIRLPDEFLLTQAKDPILYNTRYQQNPEASTDGNMVHGDWLVETDTRPYNPSTLITVWDLPFTDEENSTWCVGLVVAKKEDEFHIIDMWRKKANGPDQIDAIKYMAAKYPDSLIGVEDKANGSSAMATLHREIPNIYPFKPALFGGSKQERLSAVLKYFRDKKVFMYSPFNEDPELEPTYKVSEITRELKSFPIGSSDDIVDALSYAIAYLAEFGGESIAMITKGIRIILSPDDVEGIPNYEQGKPISYDYKYDDYDFSNIPSKSDILDINW